MKPKTKKLLKDMRNSHIAKLRIHKRIAIYLRLENIKYQILPGSRTIGFVQKNCFWNPLFYVVLVCGIFMTILEVVFYEIVEMYEGIRNEFINRNRFKQVCTLKDDWGEI